MPPEWDYIPPPPSPGSWEMPAPPELGAAFFTAGPGPTRAELEEQSFRALLEPPHPELDQAIASGESDRVLDELANLRSRYSPKATLNTAIKHAVECGQLDILRLLMANGVPVVTDNLEAAARSGHIPVLAYLMEYFSWEVDNVSDHGHTVLTLAAEHEEMVAWLLSRGADMNKQDLYAETPLCRAVQRGASAVIKMLLDAGADVTLGAPLVMALVGRDGELDRKPDLELMEHLLTRGAPVNKFVGENSSMWKQIGFERQTALHVACGYSHHNLEAVRLLLAHGADCKLNQRVTEGELPNTSAYDLARNYGYTDIIAVMREHMGESTGHKL